MRKEFVFLLKDNGSDEIKYLSVDDDDLPVELEIMTICGYHGGYMKDFEYADVTTFLTEDEFNKLVKFENDVGAVGAGYQIKDNPEKLKQAKALFKEIKPIITKLKSKKNRKFFDENVQPEEIEFMDDEYSLSESDIKSICDEFGFDYIDRDFISFVYEDVEAFGREEALSLEVVNESYDQYFNFESFGEDCITNGEGVMMLSDGRVFKARL